jgi:hypothetical protein
MGGEKFVPALKVPRECPLVLLVESHYIRRGADKSSAFPIFLFAAQPKEFFLDGLKKLEERSHKCVELRAGGICKYIFSIP